MTWEVGPRFNMKYIWYCIELSCNYCSQFTIQHRSYIYTHTHTHLSQRVAVANVRQYTQVEQLERRRQHPPPLHHTPRCSITGRRRLLQHTRQCVYMCVFIKDTCYPAYCPFNPHRTRPPHTQTLPTHDYKMRIYIYIYIMHIHL